MVVKSRSPSSHRVIMYDCAGPRGIPPAISSGKVLWGLTDFRKTTDKGQRVGCQRQREKIGVVRTGGALRLAYMPKILLDLFLSGAAAVMKLRCLSAAMVSSPAKCNVRECVHASAHLIPG